MKERKFSRITRPNKNVFDDRFNEVKDFLSLSIGKRQHLDLCNNVNNSRGLLEEAIKSIQDCLSPQVNLDLIKNITGKDTLKAFIQATKNITVVDEIPDSKLTMLPPQPEKPKEDDFGIRPNKSNQKIGPRLFKPIAQKRTAVPSPVSLIVTTKRPFPKSEKYLTATKNYENNLANYNNIVTKRTNQINSWTNDKANLENFLKYVREVAKWEYQKLITENVKDSDIDIGVAEKDIDPATKEPKKDPTGKTIYQAPKDKGYKFVNFGTFKLWSDDGNLPTVENIKQGNIGDCYLLASLMSLVKKDPGSVKNCFINRETLDTDKYAKLRLFKVDVKKDKDKFVAEPKEEIIIKVDKTVLSSVTDATTESLTDKNNLVYNKKEVLWVNIFEKAYSRYKSLVGNVISSDNTGKSYVDSWYDFYGGDGSKKFASQALSGGFGFIALTSITGKISEATLIEEVPGIKKFPTTMDSTTNTVYTQKALDIYKDIAEKLDKTKANNTKVLTASSRNEPTGVDKADPTKNIFLHKNKKEDDGVTPKSKADYGIYSGHAYSIIEGVRDDGTHKYVEVRNPHFTVGSEYEKKPDGRMKRITRKISGMDIVNEESGIVDYELNDFIKFFKRYDISDARIKSKP